jgi:hypothetical protein
MEDVRRAAEAHRGQLLAAAREEGQAQLAQAKVRLATDARAARERLTAEAEVLGGAIVDRVLGR